MNWLFYKKKRPTWNISSEIQVFWFEEMWKKWIKSKFEFKVKVTICAKSFLEPIVELEFVDHKKSGIVSVKNQFSYWIEKLFQILPNYVFCGTNKLLEKSMRICPTRRSLIREVWRRIQKNPKYLKSIGSNYKLYGDEPWIGVDEFIKAYW